MGLRTLIAAIHALAFLERRPAPRSRRPVVRGNRYDPVRSNRRLCWCGHAVNGHRRWGPRVGRALDCSWGGVCDLGCEEYLPWWAPKLLGRTPKFTLPPSVVSAREG